MPGCIIGLVGKQRSGKTLMSYLLAKALYQTAKQSGYPVLFKPLFTGG